MLYLGKTQKRATDLSPPKRNWSRTPVPIDAKCPQNVDFMTFLIITHDIGVEK